MSLNPYPERIRELHAHLARDYGQKDEQATEVLLAALLDCTVSRARRPWIIIETDYPNRDTRDAWFAFGDIVQPRVRSMALPRVQRYRASESIIEDWMLGWNENTPGLYVDAEWRRLPGAGRGWVFQSMSSYTHLQSRCVRLKVAHPRTDYATQLERDASANELARLARRVLTSDLRLARTPSEIAAMRIPAAMLYWCELVQKLTPAQQDWESFTGSIATVARNVSLLYNDGRAPDWAAAERVMRDCVNDTTVYIMRESDANAAQSKTALIENSAKSRERAFATEVTRLQREGVLLVRKGKSTSGVKQHWRYRLASADWRSLIDRGVKLFA